MDKAWRVYVVLVALLSGGANVAATSADHRVVILVAPYNVGDRLGIFLHMDGSGGATLGGLEAWSLDVDTVSAVVGEATVADEFGIPRSTWLMRTDQYWNGDLVSQGSCHVLLGGTEAVHRNMTWLREAWWSQGTRVAGVPLTHFRPTWLSGYDGGCATVVGMGGRTLKEGDVLQPSPVDVELGIGQPMLSWPGLARQMDASDPGRAILFHGRPALEFTFDFERPELWPEIARGRISLVFADGLPGAVQSELHVTWSDGRTLRSSIETTAFSAGDGRALRDDGQRLPGHDPASTPVAFQRLHRDDDGWGFRYRFDDALASLRADPTIGFEAYLARHPTAVLLLAFHTFPNADGTAEGASEAWSFSFGDETGTRVFETRRPTPSDPLLPALPVSVNSAREGTGRAPVRAHERLPLTAMPSETIIRAAERGGFDAERRTYVSFSLEESGQDKLWHGHAVSDAWAAPWHGGPESAAEQDYDLLIIDGASGGLEGAAGFRVAAAGPALVRPAPLADDAPQPRPGRLGSFTPMKVLEGLAVSAILVGIARGVLVPLYTRIARDAVLRDRARARLYERIRSEPGVHQAALVAHLGLGNGAAAHHLEKLRAHRFIFTLGEGNHIRYFASGEVPPWEARTVGLLRAGSLREVYDVYAREPTLSLRAAAKRLGMSAPSVYRAKKRLEREGLLPAGSARVAIVGKAR